MSDWEIVPQTAIDTPNHDWEVVQPGAQAPASDQQAQQGQQPPQQPNNPNPTGSESLGNMIAGQETGVGPGTAAIAGLSNAGANIGETVGDAATWVLNKLPLVGISDKTKASIDKYLKEGSDVFRTTANDQGDIFAKSMAKYPAVSAVSQAVPEVLTTAKTAAPKITAGTGLVNTAANLGTASAANAVIGAGLAGPDTKVQDRAAITSAIATPLVTAVGAGISKVATSGLLTSKLKDEVGAIQKELKNNNQLSLDDKAAQSVTNLVTGVKKIENETWNSIKELPGTINKTPIKQKITTLLEDNGSKFNIKDHSWDHSSSTLEKNQLNVLIDIGKKANGLQTMEDAIDLKKMLGTKYRLFGAGKTSDSVYNEFQATKKIVDNMISAKADEAGLTGQWKLANKFHSDVVAPIDNAGGFDVARAFGNKEADPNTYAQAIKQLTNLNITPQKLKANLNMMDSDGSQIIQQAITKKAIGEIGVTDEINKNTALLKINQYINKFDGVLSRESINVLKGTKKLLSDAGAVAKQDSGSTNNVYAQHAVGAGVGAGLGSAVGSIAGPVGAAVGGVAGMAVGITSATKVLRFVDKLLESPKGIKLLQGLGEGKPWVKQIGQLIKMAPAEMINKLEDRQTTKPLQTSMNSGKYYADPNTELNRYMVHDVQGNNVGQPYNSHDEALKAADELNKKVA